MKNKKNFLIVTILILLVFLVTACSGFLPKPTKGVISGRVLIPPAGKQLSKDISGWVGAAGAEVTIVDANGVKHTVITDENGYYNFENIAVKPNTVVTATVKVDGKTIILKDVIPQSVAKDEDYNAETMTPESTALALVVEKLVAEGVPVDLDEIKATGAYADLLGKVTEVLEKQGNVTENPDVTEGVEGTAEEIITPPTPPAPTPPSGQTTIPVNSIRIDQDDQTLVVGATLELTVTIAPANATNKNVTWTSSDETVASVSADGVVAAISEGAAVITVTTVSGNKADTISITVSKVYNQTSKTSHNTIQEAIEEATAGDTILVGAREFMEDGQIVVDKDLSIIGANKETTIIKPNQNTGSSDNERGWILVNGNVEFNLSNTTLDGENKQIYQAIRCLGTGTISNNIIKNVKYSQYYGYGVVFMGTADNFVVSNNTFTNIERIGIMAFGEGITGGEIIGNTYTGKGNGDFLDYGVEVGGGATNIEITGNTITNCGQSSTDWTSAGISINSFFADSKGSSANVTNNSIENNQAGIVIGYPTEPHESSAIITGNTFVGNNVQVQDDRTDEYSSSLDDILNSNTFPTGSMVIGNIIIVPKTNTVYNKRTGNEYSTIQEAINNANSNDTILLTKGTYEENPTITSAINLTGTEDALIIGTLSIENTIGPLIIDSINFKVAGNKNDSIVIKNVKNISIESCEFDGDGWFMAGGNRAIQMTGNNKGISIDNCTFKDGYYVTVNGYVNNLTVQNSSIKNCKSGINLQNGNDLVVTNTDISVVAQGKHNDTYCVRFANPATISSSMTISGGDFIVDKAGLEAAESIYHIPVIIRSKAAGILDVNNVIINGVIINEYKDDLSAVLSGKDVALIDENGLKTE